MEKYFFEFNRLVRTEASESYVIFNPKGRVGELNLHIQRYVHGNLVVEQKLNNKTFEALIREIEEKIISGLEPREDFIFSVYQGKEVGFYSDVVHESPYDSARRGDVERISKLLQKVLGHQQTARGQLNEFVVCEFFKSLGYDAQKASQELDQMKIDVVARNSKETVFVQVKLGSISSSEIKDVVDSVATFKEKSNRAKLVAFVADSFPPNSESLRRDLEQEYQIPIWCVHKYQIISTFPEYRRAIGRST